MSRIEFSLVIPCYNEGASIRHLVRSCKAVADHPGAEVIFVNNGSLDNTGVELTKFTAEIPNMRVVEVAVNRGYGWGILQGLKAAQGNYLGWTHADLQTDPMDAIRAINILRTMPTSGLVKGRRRNRAWSDQVFSLGMGLFESALLGTWLTEINAQPNVFPRSFFETWNQPPEDFSLDLYVYYEAKRQSIPIKRVDVLFGERKFGHSSWNINWSSKMKFIQRTVSFSLKLISRGA